MSSSNGFVMTKCFTPSVPDFPVFQRQYEKFGFDRRNEIEILVVDLESVKARLVNMRKSGYIRSAEPRPVPEVIDSV